MTSIADLQAQQRHIQQQLQAVMHQQQQLQLQRQHQQQQQQQQQMQLQQTSDMYAHQPSFSPSHLQHLSSPPAPYFSPSNPIDTGMDPFFSSNQLTSNRSPPHSHHLHQQHQQQQQRLHRPSSPLGGGIVGDLFPESSSMLIGPLSPSGGSIGSDLISAIGLDLPNSPEQWQQGNQMQQETMGQEYGQQQEHTHQQENQRQMEQQHQHQARYQQQQHQHQHPHQPHSHQQLQSHPSSHHTSLQAHSQPPSDAKRTPRSQIRNLPPASGDQPMVDSSVASKRKRAPSALAIASQESEAAFMQQDRLLTTNTTTPQSTSNRKKSIPASNAARRHSEADTSSSRATKAEFRSEDEEEEEENEGDADGAQGRASQDDDAEDDAGPPGAEDRLEDELDEGQASGAGGGGGGNSSDLAVHSSGAGGTPTPRGRRAKARGPAEEAKLKKQRLARKAELARESRKQKKDRLETLEGENAVLRSRIAQLEHELQAKVGLKSSSPLNSSSSSSAAAAEAKSSHRDKKLKSESHLIPPLPDAGPLNSPVCTPPAAGHSPALSSNGPSSSGPTVSVVSPLQQAESLQQELNLVAAGLVQTLNRTDILRAGALNVQQQGYARTAMSTPAIPPSDAVSLEFSQGMNRILELHNSRCLLSAEMSHAFESMLYVDIRGGSASHAGSSSSSSPATNPGLLPLHFFQWLLSQPAGFYLDPSGLWVSLWTQECCASPLQVTAILEIKSTGASNFDACMNTQQDPMSMEAFGPAGIMGMGAAGVKQEKISFSPHMSSPLDTAMMDSTSSTAPSALLSAPAHPRSLAPPGSPPATGFNRVHSSLLTSFEHFRSLLISHQQSELSILSQLMQILSPIQFAKFVKFAITFGPAVMSSFVRP